MADELDDVKPDETDVLDDALGVSGDSSDDKPKDEVDDVLDDALSSEDSPEGEGEGSDEDGDDDASEDGAPEQYEPFDVPDDVEVDETMMSEFGEMAKQFDLSQDKAQNLIDFHIKALSKGAEEWVNQQKTWLKEAETDEEIGGDNRGEAIQNIKAAIKGIGEPGLAEVLQMTGAISHPLVQKFFAKVGKDYVEDTDPPTDANSGGSGEAKPAHERIYNTAAA